MQTKQIEKHIRKIRLNWFIVISCFLIAVASLFCAEHLIQHYYVRWLHPSGTQQEQEQCLVRAIALHPDQLQGYDSLLDLYLDDNILTEDEHKTIRETVNHHIARLNKHPKRAAQLYRRLAFTYLVHYDADITTRLQTACAYMKIAQEYLGEDQLKETAIDAYLEINSYCTEYVWLTGSVRQPSSAEVDRLIRHVSSMLNAYANGDDAERLAYACTVAMLLSSQKDVWIEKSDIATVAALYTKLTEQNHASDPAAERLLTELNKQLEVSQCIIS